MNEYLRGGSYWEQPFIASDNRLAAMESDLSVCDFERPAGGGQVTIIGEVRFRCLFQPLMNDKEWGMADIIMAAE